MIATSGDFTLVARAMGDAMKLTAFTAADGAAGESAEGHAFAAGTHAGAGETAGSVDGGDSKGSTDVVDPAPWETVDENQWFEVNKDGLIRKKADVELKGTVTIPASARKIPKGIFNGNAKVVAVNFPANSQLTEIEAGAFEDSAITSFAMPDGVKEIQEATFKNSKLAEITFGAESELTIIGKEAFGRTPLKKMDVPGKVKEIGDSAFYNCSVLNSINLNKVEKLGKDVFLNCKALKGIGWSDRLKAIGNAAFSGTGLTSIALNNDIGRNITEWGSYIFENCTSLVTVKLPDNITRIPTGMFKGCTAVTSLTIPKTCTIIEREAFAGTSLTKIDIPLNVAFIESEAFADCQKLTEVTIRQKGAGEAGESTVSIATDAFPLKTLKFKGYDGTVEDYVNKRNYAGYTFETLFSDLSVTVTVNNKSYGKATVNKKKARQGDTIEVTVTPNEGYRLRASEFTYNSTPITKLKEEKQEKQENGENGQKSQVFTFVMPDEDVDVYVYFEKARAYGTFIPEIEQTDNTWAPDFYEERSNKWVLTFPVSGLSGRLVVTTSKDGELGRWQFTYTSSNTKVAVVDSEGRIYARGKGTANITATLKADTGRKCTIKVVVDDDADVDYDNIELKFSNLKKGKLTEETIGTGDSKQTYKVIEYTKGNLRKNEMSFDVSMNITERNYSRNLYLNSSWTSSNKEFVYVDNEKVDNNANTIRVKKGVSGEASVTVSITNGKTGKNKVTFYEESIIIRVIDTTPRLVQSTLTVNSQCQKGTAFDLLSVYDYEVDPLSLEIVQAVTTKGITDYEKTEAAGYVTVTYDSAADRHYLELTSAGRQFLADNKNGKTYNKMYIKGEYRNSEDADAGAEEFLTPIKSLVLTKKDLKPKVKLSGKLNLFFNSSASEEEQGKVTVTQSLKDLEVARYRLVSAANKDKPDTEDDPLRNNFDIDEKGVICRSGNELERDAKGKVVTSGYLEITYEGYEPCYTKITIPTQTTKPAYVLSKTKATVNASSTGYGIQLQLLDRKTKKPISLDALNELSYDVTKTTEGIFEAMDTSTARQTDTITLQIKTPQKGKAVINVEMDTWNEPMKFTFSLSVTGSVPKVKAKNSTLTLNNVCVGKEASTVFTVSQADVQLLGMDDVEYAGSAKLSSDADAIDISYDATEGVLTAVASETVQKGTYKFRMTPVVQYQNGSTEELKAITVNVKVIDTKLKAALKPASVTLNNLYVGRETSVTSYTLKNMPAGNGSNIQTGGVEIVGSNAAAERVQDSFEFVFGSAEQTISVSQNASVAKGSYKYKISGLSVDVGGSPVEIPTFTITVKVISKAAKLNVKSSGTFSPVNSSSGIVYMLTVGNANAKIQNVVLQELNTDKGVNKVYPEPEHFEIGSVISDEQGVIKGVEVLLKSGVTLDAKKSYKIRLGAVLEGAEDKTPSALSGWLTIKPKQTLPKIATDVNSATLYAGVAAGHPMRSQEIAITKTSQKDTQIDGVILSQSNSENVRKALYAEYDPFTEKVKITLVRPDMLKANTAYSVKFEVKFVGQLDNTKGTQFTVKVKVAN